MKRLALLFFSQPGCWRKCPSASLLEDQRANIPNDDFEGYTNGAALNGLNGGSGFTGAYVDSPGLTDPNNRMI